MGSCLKQNEQIASYCLQQIQIIRKEQQPNGKKKSIICPWNRGWRGPTSPTPSTSIVPARDRGLRSHSRHRAKTKSHGFLLLTEQIRNRNFVDDGQRKGFFLLLPHRGWVGAGPKGVTSAISTPGDLGRHEKVLRQTISTRKEEKGFCVCFRSAPCLACCAVDKISR
ncbi:hypothetical protein CEXT_653221 [Caerostris extrusa]|uniref:Uncharacterized protein n=1 Tax=Caerostris extrusa TaxID=172846 RepID=A0AAV4WA86_CAEEX|nr:hypothetical protein CEXT_653221 [Caerostris extrusa]